MTMLIPRSKFVIFVAVIAFLAIDLAIIANFSQQPLKPAPASSASSLEVAESTPTTDNPFQGTYTGGFWGIVTGIAAYGGDVSATVDESGKVSMTSPGPGSGTVSSTGEVSVAGTVSVSGHTVHVAYTGNVTPVKDSTGKMLAIDGKGTWKTTSLPAASGHWLIQHDGDNAKSQ